MDWKKHNILITGGSGFIGSNLANYLLKKGADVTIYDNFSRDNVRKNLKWLRSKYVNFKVVNADIRDEVALAKAVKKKTIIFHEAAQVAVTSSVDDPINDFDINARGSLNLLESIRKYSPDAIAIYASTNKVYGGLEDYEVVEKKGRYVFADSKLAAGISEKENLDFHSPYGCSKGTADQYFRDYNRIFGLKTIVFRQSCIYGPRQWGTEDQGWVFHFLKLAYQKQTLKIFGDGKQVRDLLFINDLIKAYEMSIENISKTSGQIYNVGGGLVNSVSLIEAISTIEKIIKRTVKTEFLDWRPGDQKVFISNNSKAQKDFGWTPDTTVKAGMVELMDWVKEIT